MENTLLVKFQNQHTLQLATQITLERGGVVDRVYTFFPCVALVREEDSIEGQA